MPTIDEVIRITQTGNMEINLGPGKVIVLKNDLQMRPGLEAVLPVTSAIANALETKADGVAGIKVYRALLTQTGTDAPIATVLENSLGGPLVWTRAAAGRYDATLADVFVASKVWPNNGPLAPDGLSVSGFFGFTRTDEDVMRLVTTPFNDGTTPMDDLLLATPIEILVYP